MKKVILILSMVLCSTVLVPNVVFADASGGTPINTTTNTYTTSTSTSISTSSSSAPGLSSDFNPFLGSLSAGRFSIGYDHSHFATNLSNSDLGTNSINSYSFAGALSDKLLLGANVSNGTLMDIYGRYNIGKNLYFLFGQKRFYSATINSTQISQQVTQQVTETVTTIQVGDVILGYNTNMNTNTNTNTNTNINTTAFSTENKLFYGIGGQVPLAGKLAGHAFLAGDSDYHEWAAGLGYQISKAADLHIDYQNYLAHGNNEPDLKMKGINFGVDYQF